MAMKCSRLRLIVYCGLIVIVLAITLGFLIWALSNNSSSSDSIIPDYHVVNATIANIAYTDDDGLTADFSFTLTAVNSNKNKTIDFTNSTQATKLYFKREAELPTLVASAVLPVPSPLPPQSFDNVIAFSLHAQNASLDAGNSEFFKTGKSGNSAFDYGIFARLEMEFMARLGEKSTYGPLKVICRGLKSSSQSFEVKDSWCNSYYGD